jgi:hypothetical protein
MKININERVTFTLTETGANIINKYYAQFAHPMFKDKLNHKIGDKILMSLWETMSIFGQHIHMGMAEVPFQSNSFDIQLKESPIITDVTKRIRDQWDGLNQEQKQLVDDLFGYWENEMFVADIKSEKIRKIIDTL